MFRTMKSGGLQLRANLALAGHPNQFQSKPVAIKLDWDLLQDMDHSTLLCTHCHTGNPTAWQRGIAAIYGDEVCDTRTLLFRLSHSSRTIHPTTDAKVLLMPTQKLFRLVLKDDADIGDAALIDAVRGHTVRFVDYYVRGGAMDTYSLEQALDLYEYFHVLESQDQRWSREHLFKCNCPDFFKRASCHHCLLAGMACDERIRLPGKWRGDTVQQRRRRGRPTTKPSEVGDKGEAMARDRIALQKAYVLPQVSCVHFKRFRTSADIAGFRRSSLPT